jgi:hypothetical protein
MRQTSAVIDAAGNIWTLNNWKPDFNVDVVSNPAVTARSSLWGLQNPRAAGIRKAYIS